MDNFDRIIQLFPERSSEIEHHYTNNAIFREVCLDYVEAYQAYEYWQLEGESAKKCTNDYKNLLEELQAEIRQLLDEYKNKGDKDA